MRTVISLSKTQKSDLPKEFRDDDVRFSETLVEFFLKKYTKKGDTILDIFAGFGTSLFVAEKMDRIPYGIEYDKARYEYIKGNLKQKENIINGDALKLLEYNLPQFDFFLTSPPYMTKESKDNPFTAYSTPGDYNQYLTDYGKIFNKVKRKMKQGTRVVLEIANIKYKEEVTTLAWDVAKEISKVLKFEGEVIIKWEGEEKLTKGTYGYGYDHSYCLIFRNK